MEPQEIMNAIRQDAAERRRSEVLHQIRLKKARSGKGGLLIIAMATCLFGMSFLATSMIDRMNPGMFDRLWIQRPWDNSIPGIYRWAKETLNDPSSFEVVRWDRATESYSTGELRYKVFIKFRAKNGFGALVLTEGVFTLDRSGNVIRFESLPDMVAKMDALMRDIERLIPPNTNE